MNCEREEGMALIRMKTGKVAVLQYTSKAFLGKHFQPARNPSSTDLDHSGEKVFLFISNFTVSQGHLIASERTELVFTCVT